MDFSVLKDSIPKKIENWNHDDVHLWLNYIGMADMHSKFKQNGFIGNHLFNITQEEMKSKLQLNSNIKTKKLLKWVQYGFQKYEEHLTVNNINVVQEDSEHESIFNRSFVNQDIVEVSSDNETQTCQDASKNNDGEFFSFTNVNARKPTLLDVKKSVKKSLSTVKRELLIMDKDRNSARCYLFVNRGGRIGRSSSNEIILLGNEVNSVHALLEYENGQFYLQRADKNSQSWIKVSKPTQIVDQCICQMGNLGVIFSLKQTNVLQLQCIEQQTQAKAQNFVTLRPIQGVRLKIGRNSRNDLGFPMDQLMTTYHAQIFYLNGKWWIQDLDSLNGYFQSLRFRTWVLLNWRVKIIESMIFRIANCNEHFLCNLKTNGVKDSQILARKPASLCKQCRQEQVNCYFVPCRHSQFCQKCSLAIKKESVYCLYCSSKIEDVVTYFAV